ncbi:DUF3107 domain-containing protein [Microbacterium sp. YY-01]|uniref:DUF3107 domain-containing protein n=1 Tax=Microbacterium sp. YY-01 TaxID=3421634 RepID=UPI003D16A1A6
MEIRIGIINSGRELNFETSQTAADVQANVAEALERGAPHITLTDTKGATYIVPTAHIGFVELGSEESRRVGFVA